MYMQAIGLWACDGVLIYFFNYFACNATTMSFYSEQMCLAPSFHIIEALMLPATEGIYFIKFLINPQR